MDQGINRRRMLCQSGAVVAGTALAAYRQGTGQTTCPQPETATARNNRRKMKLGLVTYNIAPQWDLATLIQCCRKAGLEAVELRTTHKHGVEPALSKAQRAEVKKQFADSGLVLWGLGTTCEYHSPDPAVLAKNIDQTREFAELAHDVGAKGIKVRPNGLVKDIPEEKTLEQIGKALQTCGKAAADLGIEVWLEVHGRDTSHPPRIRTIMDIADQPNVGVNWNSNASDIKDGSVKPYFDLLRDKLMSIHINELTSEYPWRELFGLLNQTGYDRYALIEIQGLKSEHPDDIIRFLQYYRSLWDVLSSA